MSTAGAVQHGDARGGRAVHPVNVRVGGFYRLPDREALAELRPVLARQMEVFAGFLEHTDHHIGRLVDAIDNWTMVIAFIAIPLAASIVATLRAAAEQRTGQYDTHFASLPDDQALPRSLL